jgi:hypothetical protein
MGGKEDRIGSDITPLNSLQHLNEMGFNWAFLGLAAASGRDP